MIIGLQAATAGLEAEQVSMNAIADDIANDNTPGFKAVFASAVSTQPVSGPGLASPTVQLAAMPAGVGPATQVYYGGGAAAIASYRDWGQGGLTVTKQPWDLAIEGNGLFRVRLTGGQNAYTRAGNFSLDGGGTLVDAFGHEVLSTNGTPITVSVSKGPTAVSPDGTVTQGGTKLAQIGLANFRSLQGLQPGPDGEWLASAASGPALAGTAGSAGFGTIIPGALETSNTSMSVAMASLIEANSAFQMDAKAVMAANSMWSSANQIKA